MICIVIFLNLNMNLQPYILASKGCGPMCKECGGHSLILWFRGADDKAEKEHLLALAGGDEARVHFFPCDLLGGATMLTAARGCSGIFHLASPCIINRILCQLYEK
ncbi:hypothetical protein VPH35_066821 [Triticum aestivum]|uniref:Uncharacterized protein n=1 Tax=Triticum turgidum subsp. durum TaxID=4567 RepID=A0A9R0SF50_TRITD|nr:unnamed protein product [Triticum turgidum subsp. durum]